MKVQNENPFHPIRLQCRAKTRAGTPCCNWQMRNRNRCRIHGGKSTGARTPEGKAISRRANWRHGKRSVGRIKATRLLASALKGDGPLSPEALAIVEMLLEEEGAGRLTFKQIIKVTKRLAETLEAKRKE